MPKPSLPPLSPPSIPSGRVVRGEPQKKSNFFFIAILTFLIVWSFQLLSHKKDEMIPPTLEPAPEESVTTAAPLPLPNAEESQKRLDEMGDAAVAAAQKPNPLLFPTLGSADPESPYRMLVTLSTNGASITRLELNEANFQDSADHSGYLGQIIANETVCDEEFKAGRRGIAVQVVGAGTPAAKASLAAGDRICTILRQPRRGNAPETPVEIDSFETFRSEMLMTLPGDTVTLGVIRAANADTADAALENISVELVPAPMSLLRPSGPVANYSDYKNLTGLQGNVIPTEDDFFTAGNFDVESVLRKRNSDPASFLMTLAEYDETDKLAWPKSAGKYDRRISTARSKTLDDEMTDLSYQDGNWSETAGSLRGGNWEYLTDESNETTAVFRKVLLGRRLEFRKTYKLEPSATENGRKAKFAKEYHITLSVECRNLDPNVAHKVSYFLDGPTGLPIEGAWYAAGRKTGPGWGTYGLRDMVLGLNGGRSFHVIKCTDIVEESKMPSDQVDVDFLGIDTQYFQCTLLPQREGNQAWPAEYLPIRVGARIANLPTFTNTSFRLKSPVMELAQAGTDGASVRHDYTIFAGPKQQELLNAYGLGNTLVYGWFWFVSKPLVAILHFFKNYLVFNYGLAIILLTILVRSAMFPLTRKQIISSLKMQQLQPQLNILKKRYENNPQQMMAAQQALWKKNKVNPLGGCLPLLIQMPIFIGLYKALSLDVNLYGTPLLSRSIRWCSNLAAPDMMIDWSQFWHRIGWDGFNVGQGMLSLGPFFNLLPCVTIVLFLLQQKFMMPPPTGTEAEQAQQRSMRRMMKFMMLFFGIMFFKVPSGLCIYFIASSMWALLERRFHPKVTLDTDTGIIDVESKPAASAEPRFTGGVSRNRNERQEQSRMAAKPTGLKAWWNDLLERAKEQQKLAKAEVERTKRDTSRSRTRNRR